MAASASDASADTVRPPLPLTVAAALSALEGIVLAGQGLLLIPALSEGRVAMGLTTTVFFVVYGGFLAFCAWRLHLLRSWARAPVVLAQLVQILVAISFWGGSTSWLALVLFLVGVAALVGIFHPASLAALAAADED